MGRSNARRKGPKVRIKRAKLDQEWSKAIRRRDRYTCQRCGRQHPENSQGLHAAHIFGRGNHRVRHDMENGLAMCFACHRIIDADPEEKILQARKKLGDDGYESLRRRAQGLDEESLRQRAQGLGEGLALHPLPEGNNSAVDSDSSDLPVVQDADDTEG